MINRVSKGYTGVSAANTAKTHTIAAVAGKAIYLNSLALSLKGADSAADIDVTINDGGGTVWAITMRAGGIMGGFFDFSNSPLVISNGDLTVISSAAGDSCIVRASLAYEQF